MNKTFLFLALMLALLAIPLSACASHPHHYSSHYSSSSGGSITFHERRNRSSISFGYSWSDHYRNPRYRSSPYYRNRQYHRHYHKHYYNQRPHDRHVRCATQPTQWYTHRVRPRTEVFPSNNGVCCVSREYISVPHGKTLVIMREWPRTSSSSCR